MRATGHRPRRAASIGLVLALVQGCLGIQAGTGPPARAATTQLHGVNWADYRDNYLTDPNVPIGLSTSDNYANTYAKATPILKGFQNLGATTIRFGINPETTSSFWWNSLVAAYDAAGALGMNVMIA